MKTANTKIETYYQIFDEGEDVFVQVKDRRFKASVILQDGQFVKIEDADGVFRDVLADECTRVCKGCDGAGTLFYPARQRGGDIVDEEEIECRLCKGTGEAGHEDDDYDPDCIY